MLRVQRIIEDSLTPEYSAGDFVLIAKIPCFFSIAPGDVIAFHRQPYGMMIKRVQAVSPDGKQLTVLGSHPTSVDSRTIGPVYLHEVAGKVIWHIKPS